MQTTPGAAATISDQIRSRRRGRGRILFRGRRGGDLGGAGGGQSAGFEIQVHGGFGGVYKGFVRPLDPKADRIVVAVKRLNTRGLQVLFRQLGCARGISSDGAIAAVSAVRHDLWLRRKRAKEMVVVACAARKSFRESLKVLEADIQRASVVNVVSPEGIGLLEGL